MPIFKGSGTAIVTPMDENLKINFDAFEKLVDFQLQNETDAIIVCGTTGEASTLSDEEQIEAVRFVVSRVNKKIPVIAGAGSNDTAHAVHLCKESKKAGADGLLIVTPYYNKGNKNGLIAHFGEIAKATDLPIILYNVPSRTGLNLLPKVVFELSKIDTIVAIKEACANLSQIAELLSLVYGKMDVYSGNDDEIVQTMALGGLGIISVLANVIPKDIHDITAKFFNKDIEGAAKLQLNMVQLYKAMFCEVNPVPVKAALNEMGYNAGGHRLPLSAMEPENLALLKKAMKDYGIL